MDTTHQLRDTTMSGTQDDRGVKLDHQNVFAYQAVEQFEKGDETIRRRGIWRGTLKTASAAITKNVPSYF